MAENKALVMFAISTLISVAVSFFLAVLNVPSPLDFFIPVLTGIQNSIPPNAPAPAYSAPANAIIGLKLIGDFLVLEPILTIASFLAMRDASD